MMRPHLPLRISLAASRDTRKVPNRLVSSMPRAAAGGMIIEYCEVSTAALLMTMSTRPRVLRTCSKPRATDSASPTSTAMGV
jgi:hypothetical protein